MSVLDAEILVIGGGMAGVAAALSAVEAGRRVALVKRAPGATSMSTGAFDLAPHPRGWHLAKPDRDPTQLECLEALVRASPGHPYALIGRANEAEYLQEAFSFVLEKLEAGGLPHANFDPRDPGHHAVTSTGRLRRAASSQASHVLRDFNPDRARIGVVRLARCLGGLTGPPPMGGNVIEVDWPSSKNAPFLLPADIGKLLDEEGESRRFVEIVVAACKGRGFSHIVLPPVLGVFRTREILNELEEATRAVCCEALGGEASLPGIRLENALRRSLERAGVTVETGRTLDGAEVLERRGGPVVLASGRFIGGGVARRQGSMTETVFGLPIHDGESYLDDQPAEMLSCRSYRGPHSLFRAGLRVDDLLRPLDMGNRPLHETFFAAGSVIGGYDPHVDGCGLGVAVVTGYRAGRLAAGLEAS